MLFVIAAAKRTSYERSVTSRRDERAPGIEFKPEDFEEGQGRLYREKAGGGVDGEVERREVGGTG